MKIQVWSEVISPWCGLVEHRLDLALERFLHRDKVRVIHRSFPLDLNLPPGPGIPVRRHLQGYGMSDAQAEALVRGAQALAERDGLWPCDGRNNLVADTQLTHEFLAYATSEGKNNEAWRRVFRAYFFEASSIFGLDSLLELADELGLDRGRTRQALRSRRFRRQVMNDAQQARCLGAHGAPFIVIGGHHTVAGTQESDALLDAVQRAWDMTHLAVPLPREASAVYA